MYELFLAAFVTFFVIIDPPGVAPLFATLTENTSRKWQQKMAIKSVLVAAFIIVGFAFGGQWLLSKLHVSINAFRVAGGVLLFLIAVDMLFEKRSERRDERNEKVLIEAHKRPDVFEDVSVFPLAIPLLAGPGAIASIMLYFAQYDGIIAKLTILGGVGVNLLICLCVFWLAGPITKFMGKTVATMIERILGIILAALASQFIIDGIKGAFSL